MWDGLEDWAHGSVGFGAAAGWRLRVIADGQGGLGFVRYGTRRLIPKLGHQNHPTMPVRPLRFILLILPLYGFGQVQNLYFVKKGQPVVFAQSDYQPNEKGAFYLYRNCQYDVILRGGDWESVRVLDIRGDSIYGTAWRTRRWDSVVFAPSELKAIRMMVSRRDHSYSVFSLTNYTRVFENAPERKAFPRQMDTVTDDSGHVVVYEVIPRLRWRALDSLYECDGKLYYDGSFDYPVVEGLVPRDGPFFRQPKKHRVRRGVWVTPSGAEDIRGVNIGLMTSNFSANHMLNIRGVNLNADVGSAFISFMLVPYIPFMILSDLLPGGRRSGQDSVLRHGWPETQEWSPEAGDPGGRISGLSISGGGLFFPSFDVSGVAINGGLCSVPKFNGMVVTGLMTMTNEFHGVMITGFLSIAEKGRGLQIGTVNGCGEMRGGQIGLLNGCREMRGVQIGLYNRCKQGKGIQIGLWNVNGKRKLPLINWRFR